MMQIIPGWQSSTELMLKSAKHHSVVWFFTLLFPAHIMLTLVRFVAEDLQIVLVFFLV